MKIEMGESLIYSWLRHEKLCQLVQTNWKVSPFWELENRQDVEALFVICRNYFLEKHSFDISKGCSLEQFLKQAEIDGIGIVYSTEVQYIYAVDVAYHEGGLNYGKKDETIAKIAQKCIRTALCLYGYFSMSTGEVLFVSPKITPAIETALVPLFDEISELLHDNGLNIKAILHCNDNFSSEVMYPVVEKASAVADTSELFMRGLQLYNLATKVEPKRDEISSVTTTQCKLKATSVAPADNQEWKAIRRIPDWAVAPNQINHRIIRAFLQLQKERGFVCRPELEARCQDPEGHADVYVRDFRGNFASMKTDAGKSHGKVFRDDGYNIKICPEVLATLEQYRSLFET